MPSEPRFQPTELAQIHADIRKLMAETMRVHAEICTPFRVRKLYPGLVVGGVIAAVGVTTGVVLAFLLKLH